MRETFKFSFSVTTLLIKEENWDVKYTNLVIYWLRMRLRREDQ